MKVSLFVPCLIEQFHPEVAVATARCLARAGLEVHFPKNQTCCGQPVYKSGLRKATTKVAKHFISVFEDSQMVVAPSGSCVAMVRNEYPVLFRDDPVWRERALELGKRVFELTEFLVNKMGIEDLGAQWKGKAVYHDSCQVYRALGIYQEPRKLLAHVKRLDLVEMDRQDLCCGFGGPFSLKFPEISEAMVEEKVSYILATGAQYVIGAEISCLMNIGGYLEKQGHRVKAVHIAEVLGAKGQQ